MNKTVITDDIDRLIANRLAERQRKVRQMMEWESAPARRRRWMKAASAMSVAAGLALVFFLKTPGILSSGAESGVTELMARPHTSTFRAACPQLSEVERLMDAGNHAEALAACESVLLQSNRTLEEYEHLESVVDDEMAYEIEMENTMNHEIRWTYIYLLLQNGREEDALKQINKCMLHAKYCCHIDEAKVLRKKLQKK